MARQKKDPERGYYLKLIGWQVASLIAIASCLLMTSGDGVVVTVLALVTVSFGWLAWQKRSHIPS